MEAIKHIQLDSTTFAEVMRGTVDVVEVEDLSQKVPHVGFGGASKSRYVSPTNGDMIFVLERNGMYSPDAYINDVWQFRQDFSASDAAKFLAEIDGAKNA